MPDPIRDYFDRTNPIRYVDPRPPRTPHPQDIYGAWDRLARQLYVTVPNQLDRARSFRNRYIQAVR